jgi:YVTN family beta-propeller protein
MKTSKPQSDSPGAVYRGHIFLDACTALAIGLLPMGSAYAAQAKTGYHITRTVPLGPGERWDYVTFDPNMKRLYIAHGDHVTVVDEKAGKVIGQIGTFAGGTHGIAISETTHHGYTDDGKAGMAIEFDVNSLKPGKRIAAAPDADGIIYDAVTGHIYVVNGDSGSLTVIDPATNAAIATIDVGAGLEAGVADGKGMLFVDGAENHDIVKINARTNKVEAHYDMPACKRPHGLAMDKETRRLFSTCANNVMVVVDADNGANIATLPIGTSSDGAAFDPVRKLAFSSNGDGTLNVIHEQDARTFVSVETVKTPRSARTMAIDPATGRLFLVAADVEKIDPPASTSGRPHVTYVANSLKLLYLDPAN